MPTSTIVLRLLIATALGTTIGIEREVKNRPAGMRTHVLVCLGACMVALLEGEFAAALLGAPGGATYNFGRLSAQVISGIGFLGAGTILFTDRKIMGLTTAASLWNVACLGLATGYGYLRVALGGAACVLMTLLMMQKIIHVHVTKKVEVRFIKRVETIEYINAYFEAHGIRVLDLNFSVVNKDDRNIYTNIYTLHMPGALREADVINTLSEHANILAIRTTNV